MFGHALWRRVVCRAPTRFYRQLYVAQVGPFAFRTLHRMEGRWTGDAEVHMFGRPLSAAPDVRVCTVQCT
ncbi:hypothetical protein EON67_10190 [archaeon]|nr:MAG: hypothetical protein EON67_10190 [archaeon]